MLLRLAARDARVANETVSVTVNTAADTTSAKALATAAYAARQVIYDANPSLKVLDAKKIIPANGYLVLGDAGVEDPKANIADKKTAAQKLYNKSALGLPFPASDLSNFFRNGGTLNLAYQDITAATDSGHDEAALNADTGSVAATTNAYTAGTVIINEVMWGLDGAAITSQYIELHNTTAVDITLDTREWVIAVGSAPTGFTVIDSVGNNPATGWWQVPGSDGVSVVEPSAGFFTLVDLVSMSRVADSTDGTAAASWAASMRPSANLSGRRVGTAGAANNYVMPTVVAPPTPPVVPATAVATAADIRITEIMVASNDGRLPQWIELSNVSAAAVSLSGWSLEIDNDSADADVVGESIEIDLGDVEIGADQVALVVSKESARNSGVGDGDGDLRADRIIDVQSDVSPTNARYSLISEMGFMLSLIPPRTGAVRTAWRCRW